MTRVLLTRSPIEPEADVFYQPDLSGFTVAHERAGADGVRFIELVRSS